MATLTDFWLLRSIVLDIDFPGTLCGPLHNERFEVSWQDDYLKACMLSDVGIKREKNEDACVLCAPEHGKLRRLRGVMMAVADGMGGASAGEHASHLALKVLTESYYEGNRPQTKVPIALRIALESANMQVFDEASEDAALAGMGTTVSALAIVGNWAYIAQVGDSRVYHYRPGVGLEQITLDHSLVEEQVRIGVLTPDEARNHTLKNLITRAVGIRKNVDVDLFVQELQKDDILFLCSDGLTNMVDDTIIAEELGGNTPEEALQHLLDAALEAGGIDNITAIVLKVTAVPPKMSLQKIEEIPLIQPNGFLRRLWNRIRPARN